jgi:phage terminase large subunit-like protein
MVSSSDQPSTTSLGTLVIEWIEEKLFVPEGRWIGTKVKLASWQKKEILRIYDNPATTRRAILSFGRKNGKTSLAAMLLLVHLCGPASVINSQLYSTAQSRDQAALIFSLAAKMVRMSPELDAVVQIKDGSKQLHCPERGTAYRALSAEAATAYGLSPIFVIHDELGQVRGPRSELYEAVETATGAQEFPLSIIISTQAPADADLLSVLIDDAMAGNDPRVICSLYTVPKDFDGDPFALETIRLANPALGNFLNPTEVLAMAEDARRMPAREAAFRNLILNQRVEASNPFVTPAVWKSCGFPVLPFSPTTPLYGGLDLSSVADLTALVLIGQPEAAIKRWHVHPTFWLPQEGLAEKSRLDRVPYDLWARQGYLETTEGSTIKYEDIAIVLREMFSRFNIRKLAFDRWNMKHLKPWLERAGFSVNMIEERFVEFGQGTQSMSPALRSLEELLYDKLIAHGNHPVLAMCAMCAIVEGKDDANRKLSKNKSSGRIDGLVAMAMAVGVAHQMRPVDVSTLIA